MSYNVSGYRYSEWDCGVAYERETAVRNQEGLHFRPIMRIVDLAANFNATLSVHVEDRQADGRSPMELLMLVATEGARLRLRAEGPDEKPLVDAIVALIESGFHENETN